MTREPSTSSFVPVVTLDLDESESKTNGSDSDSECSSFRSPTVSKSSRRRLETFSSVISTKSLRFADFVVEKEIEVPAEPVHIALCRQLTAEREERGAARRKRGVRSSLKKVWRAIY